MGQTFLSDDSTDLADISGLPRGPTSTDEIALTSCLSFRHAASAQFNAPPSYRRASPGRILVLMGVTGFIRTTGFVRALCSEMMRVGRSQHAANDGQLGGFQYMLMA